MTILEMYKALVCCNHTMWAEEDVNPCENCPYNVIKSEQDDHKCVVALYEDLKNTLLTVAGGKATMLHFPEE